MSGDGIIIASRVFSVFVILFGLFWMINLINKNKKDARKELLDKMLKNKDISSDTYVKYLDVD